MLQEITIKNMNQNYQFSVRLSEKKEFIEINIMEMIEEWPV